MLFKASVLDEIAAGRVTLAFRRWTRPSVCAGGSLRTSVGMLSIDEVSEIRERDLSGIEARKAGYSDREALLNDLRRKPGGQLYRIRFHFVGPDPREALRESDDLEGSELVNLTMRLARLDQASNVPWTMRYLSLVGEAEGRAAASLAKELGVEKAVLKRRMRKLKELGLTESLRTGYRLSRRGRAALQALAAQEKSPTSPRL